MNLKPLLPGHVLICPLHHCHQHKNNNPQQPEPEPEPQQLLVPRPSSDQATPPSRLGQLTPAQTADLFATVRRLTPTLSRLYHASAFNIAIQDGEAAGQSVPHVHVHVIPRKSGDMDERGGGDRLYEMMERGQDEGDIGAHLQCRDASADDGGRGQGGGVNGGKVDEGKGGGEAQGKGRGKFPGPDAQREPRSQEEMRQEAEWLRRELGRDGIVSAPPPSTSDPKEGPASTPDLSIGWKPLLTNLAWIATGFGLATIIHNNTNTGRSLP